MRPTLTREQVATEFGIEVGRLNDLKKLGIVADAAGNYDEVEVLRGLVKRLHERIEYFDSQGEIAALLGCTNANVTHVMREGVFSVDKKGNLPREEITMKIVRWLQDKARKKTTDLDDKKEKLRIEKELLQIQLDKAKGVTLEAVEVERAWANIVQLCKCRLLRIPNKLAPRIPFCKNEREIEAEIQKEIDESLHELSRDPDYEAEKIEQQDAK